MPKQVQKFARFEGGINEGSDPRDVSENELVKSDNTVVDELGKIRLIGDSSTEIKNASGSNSGSYSATKIFPGYGLFSYSTDYAANGDLKETDWVAILNEADGNIELRHRTGTTTATINNAIDLGNDDDSNQAEFFFADGALRVSQANLEKAKDTKWYGYIKENFYHTTDGSTASGTPASERSAWTQLIASPRNPSDLSVNLDLHDASSANPSSGTVGSTAGDKLVLSYIKSSNGGWNGVFSFGATFLYKGGAESSMTKFSETIACNEEKVSFQLYVPIGTNSSISADSGNFLGDDRIIGVNIYFKEFESKSYNLLTTFDLLSGGENHWKKVNSDTTTAYGVFDGTVVINNSEPAKTTENSSLDHYSYADTSVTINITNNAASAGFLGRAGYVRVYGAHVSPLYKGATTNLATGGVVVPMKNGAAGTRAMKAELLDESFNVIAESDEVDYTVVESGRAAPPNYEETDPYGGDS